MPVNHSSAIDKLLDYIPDLMEKVNATLNKQINNKKEEKREEEHRIEKQRKEGKENAQTEKMIQNIGKVHPKRNKPIKYEVEYNEIPIEYDVEEDNLDE